MAFGVKVCTASHTADMSRSVFCYTVPSDREAARVLSILVLISFHGAFFSRSRS